MDKVGGWSFLVGIVVAIVISFMVMLAGSGVPAWAIWLLAILGVIVGALNVSPTETKMFLLAAVAFLLSFQSLSSIAGLLGGTLESGVSAFFQLMAVFVAPAAAVVAVVAIFHITRD